MSDSTIACVHIPRFAVEAERRRRDDAAARLILIGDGTVYDCSLGASASSSVRPGMRMTEAVALFPQALVIPPDIPYYECTFDAMLDVLDGVSPAVEAADAGTAFLSLAGLREHPKQTAHGIISTLHRRTGFMAAAGVAHTKFAARIAAVTATPGAAKYVPKGEERNFLAPLPVDLLPAGEAMLWRLRLLGIETIGEVARMPLGAFQAQFGPEGRRCWHLACGHDDEPLIPRVREETVVRRLQMPAPATTLDAILTGIERLLRSAFAGDHNKRLSGRYVRKAVIRGTLDAGGAWELPVAFREALSNPQDAWIAVKAAVARRPPGRPVEELEVELTGLSGESGKQASMFEGRRKLWRQVEESLKQLQTQQQAAPVGKIVPLQPWSRIPERRAALVERQGDV